MNSHPSPTCKYLNPTPESLRNPSALFLGPKTASKWPKTTTNRQNTCFLRYFALFLAPKSARRVRTPRDHLQLPQTTPIKPQEPQRTFFWAQNGLKMAKNDQKPPKHVFFEIFRAIFSAKKCAEGAHAPCPLETTSNHPQKASGTPAHFFFGPKRPQNGQNDPQQM